MPTVAVPIHWTFDPANPIVRPGQLHDALDAARAGAAHVLQLDDRMRMYYWATGSDGRHRICVAESPRDRPNAWEPLGSVLEPQVGTEHNHHGPSFPCVVPQTKGPWLMYFGAWGKPRPDGKLPNTTGLAFSHDAGQSWEYWSDRPVLPLDRPYDAEGTGSVWVLHESGEFRMYYTALGAYFPRPEGVQSGHGDLLPRIGIGYTVSSDGVHWNKPLGRLMVEPRGFGTEPYEYICSKPCVIREPDGYRMWVNTFGTAYRVRSLWSTDGLQWNWCASGPDGDMGVGEKGSFDDHQRCYVSIVKHDSKYRCWYSANGFGSTGMGYAVGHTV